MNEKITTIEGLAGLIQRTMASKEDLTQLGDQLRSELASKEDLKAMASKEDLKALETRLDARMDNLDARMGLLQSDVHDIKEDMVHQHDFEDVRDRVKYVERKLGIESGV